MGDPIDDHEELRPIYCECGPLVGRIYGRADAVGRTWFYAVPEQYHASPSYDVSDHGWLSNGEVDGQPFVMATHLSITTTGKRIEIED